jgi:ABC-type spermidine/putrescine transport system permease subunit I
MIYKLLIYAVSLFALLFIIAKLVEYTFPKDMTYLLIILSSVGIASMITLMCLALGII